MRTCSKRHESVTIAIIDRVGGETIWIPDVRVWELLVVVVNTVHANDYVTVCWYGLFFCKQVRIIGEKFVYGNRNDGRVEGVTVKCNLL